MDNITALGVLLPRFIMELLAAIVCGALLGIERGGSKRGITLRDTTLICFGATLLMMVSELVDLNTGESNAATDPGRLAGYVIAAAGLVAAGVTFRGRASQGSIGAAATVWVTAGIGILIGTGYPLLGLLITGGVMLTLMLVRGLEGHVSFQQRPLLLKVTAREDSPDFRRQLQTVLERQSVRAESFRAEPVSNGVKLTIAAPLEPTDLRPLIAALWTLQGVIEVEH